MGFYRKVKALLGEGGQMILRTWLTRLALLGALTAAAAIGGGWKWDHLTLPF
jgi:hypothetical protein